MAEGARRGTKVALLIKCLCDKAMAVLGLILLFPLLSLIALFIKLDSRGSVLFSQVRAGLGGRSFTMYKFRTMVPGAEQGGLSVLPADPRVTRMGHWLRSFSLDELPQLINILKGEMSLVGPRPLLPAQVEHMTPIERRRLEMLPGLTNLPALYGRNRLTFDKRMRFDVWYVEHWSLWLDAKILLKTPWIVLRRDGAYASPEAAAAAARRQVDRSAANTPSNTPLS
jgi:lipopolysaccharide/colanic/teichoic acid biosynthesis glycosyltransferase